MRWITSRQPRIDRIACSWLIRRFVDRDAEFRFVPADDVLAEARRCGGVPFDVPGAALRRGDGLCSFDAVLARYGVDDAALRLLAAIVRAADCGRTAGAPQSAGLLAIAYGLSRCFRNDDELLQQGFVVYDALYQWCRKAPPGTDFALPRVAAPADGWRQALCRQRARARAARILAALDAAAVREIALERVGCSHAGPRLRAIGRSRAPAGRAIEAPLHRDRGGGAGSGSDDRVMRRISP